MLVPFSNCDWMMYLLKVPKFSKIKLYPKKKRFAILHFDICILCENTHSSKKCCPFVKALEGNLGL